MPHPVLARDRGALEHDIAGATKPPAAKTPLVVAQVTVAGANINKVRALRASMEEQNALFGVYITLEKINSTPSLRQIASAAGIVKERRDPCAETSASDLKRAPLTDRLVRS